MKGEFLEPKKWNVSSKGVHPNRKSSCQSKKYINFGTYNIQGLSRRTSEVLSDFKKFEFDLAVLSGLKRKVSVAVEDYIQYKSGVTNIGDKDKFYDNLSELIYNITNSKQSYLLLSLLPTLIVPKTVAYWVHMEKTI